FAAGEAVMVTATLDPTGVAWPAELPPGGGRTSDTTAPSSLPCADVTCHLGSPRAPTVVQASCAGGVVREATIAPAHSYGIAYSLDPEGPYDPSVDTQVTVTATALEGYGWESMPPGWTQVDS